MKNLIRTIFFQKVEINYLYFSCFLIFISALSFSHFWNWDHPLNGIPVFFFFYAIGQALLEVFFFIFFAYILNRWAHRWIYFLFIAFSFILMLLHFTDFLMVRVLDTSVNYLFKFFFGSGLNHLLAGFQALNMNTTMIVITFLTTLLLPIIGLGFYHFTAWLGKRKPISLSLNQIILAISILGGSLLLLDLIAHPFLNRTIYTKYQKALPLGATFLEPAGRYFSINPPLPPFRDEEDTVRHIPQLSVSHLPNIYLFIIETLRQDFLSAAPQLCHFGAENIRFKRSFSNSSATHLSWFSILHANLPIYWADVRDHWKKGSIPLQMLQKMGYRISVYSSADLQYFNMDQLLFGKDKTELKIEEHYADQSLPACERDVMTLENLTKNLQPEGNVYLIFLDSTHSEYSFPPQFPLQYTPIAKEIDYLTIGPKSPEVELIKNRYRNAIAYIDHLMGNFFTSLKEKKLYDNGIIAITGDHGEEFFEEGALFHGTHLNHYQTAVPIFFKFPSKDWTSQTEETTHIDIFPSILHYLTKQSQFDALCDGSSIFSLERPPFRIAVLQNGTENPFEFLLEKSDLKLRARLIHPSQIEILELQGFLKPDILLALSKKN
jgi:glucan phosphoethanolaminetransferase (alkaline phosphatase superfamily)